MNRYDFTQPGGLPFDQGTMDFIQSCINTAASTATLAGPTAILSGCVIAGGTAGNGVVVINGEILPFTGGVIQTKVKIVEVATSVVFQDGAPRVVKYERAASFGDDGVTTLLWANFKRNTAEGILARLDRVEGLLRPFSGAGGAVWWKGAIADIPTGWREVVAWRGRLPMGYNPDDVDFATIGSTGGAKTHTNTVSEMASHSHNWMADVSNDNLGGSGWVASSNNSSGSGTDGLHSHISETGNGEAYSILNPYKVGCWIEPIPGTF